MTETDESTMTETNDPTVTTESRDITASLYWAALAGLVLLAAVTALQFYLSGSRAIGIWVSAEYEPLFQAAFNLVLLLASGIGISRVVARLRE